MKKNQTSFLVLPDDESQMICPNCSCSMRYKYGGIFVCDSCGKEIANDYGKIKKYLDEHGPTSAFDLARETGVPSAKISSYLRQGNSGKFGSLPSLSRMRRTYPFWRILFTMRQIP